ncbi:MAG: glutamine-hydrolyzing GMP synthase, partial [Deltaproteobacteria bacterium]|nr:glutamine-hydrolyzing GMP synthase [Deltaproteobacteria bacterium]
MNKVLILDFGSQYTQLIARRVRELRVYCEIQPCTWSLDKIRAFAPKGIILSGGPASVLEAGAPSVDRALFDLSVPVLGICYGMQLMAHLLGGKVEKSQTREYGQATLTTHEAHQLFEGVTTWPMSVWMSHGDRVIALPNGFSSISASDHSPHAAIADTNNRLIGIQFHPEVVHTPEGKTLLANFLYRLCGISPAWTMASFVETKTAEIRKTIGKEKVILGLSGGVDSSVAAVLIHRAIGDQLTCIFVDNGLLRKGEVAKVERVFRDAFHIPLVVVDASERFLASLRGVEDPEQKRKIIGREFITVFEAEAKKIPGVTFLAQGTLYPDVIESVSF